VDRWDCKAGDGALGVAGQADGLNLALEIAPGGCGPVASGFVAQLRVAVGSKRGIAMEAWGCLSRTKTRTVSTEGG